MLNTVKDFWINSPQHMCVVIQKFLIEGFVEARTVIQWIFASTEESVRPFDLNHMVAWQILDVVRCLGSAGNGDDDTSMSTAESNASSALLSILLECSKLSENIGAANDYASAIAEEVYGGKYESAIAYIQEHGNSESGLIAHLRELQND